MSLTKRISTELGQDGAVLFLVLKSRLAPQTGPDVVLILFLGILVEMFRRRVIRLWLVTEDVVRALVEHTCVLASDDELLLF